MISFTVGRYAYACSWRMSGIKDYKIITKKIFVNIEFPDIDIRPVPII